MSKQNKPGVDGPNREPPRTGAAGSNKPARDNIVMKHKGSDTRYAEVGAWRSTSPVPRRPRKNKFAASEMPHAPGTARAMPHRCPGEKNSGQQHLSDRHGAPGVHPRPSAPDHPTQVPRGYIPGRQHHHQVRAQVQALAHPPVGR